LNPFGLTLLLLIGSRSNSSCAQCGAGTYSAWGAHCMMSLEALAPTPWVTDRASFLCSCECRRQWQPMRPAGQQHHRVPARWRTHGGGMPRRWTGVRVSLADCRRVPHDLDPTVVAGTAAPALECITITMIVRHSGLGLAHSYLGLSLLSRRANVVCRLSRRELHQLQRWGALDFVFRGRFAQ
jgi:hypothetical protein